MSTQSTIINEVIETGKAERKLIDKAAKLWLRISRWTHASDVEFYDGKTAQDKVGAINGISSDFNVGKDDIAASSILTKNIKDDLNEGIINDHLQFVFDEDGTLGYKKDGADTVIPFINEDRVGKIIKPEEFDAELTPLNFSGKWMYDANPFNIHVSYGAGGYGNHSIFNRTYLLDLRKYTKIQISVSMAAGGNGTDGENDKDHRFPNLPYYIVGLYKGYYQIATEKSIEASPTHYRLFPINGPYPTEIDIPSGFDFASIVLYGGVGSPYKGTYTRDYITNYIRFV